MDALKAISEYGILPVISIENDGDAIPLASALSAGGLPLLELTLRSPVALRSISRIREEFPAMLLAAGTVITPVQADEAISAGADILVSPGYSQPLVDHCLGKGYSIVPGCTGASDVLAAKLSGLDMVKFFPTEQLGGIDSIRMLTGPFPEMRFLPTGGLGFELLPYYLRERSIAACGGSFMAKKEDILSGNFRAVVDGCRRAVDASLGFELAHLGVNSADAQEAEENAAEFSRLFRLPIKNGNSSVFAGKVLEAMKSVCYGERGHIGMYTNSVERAMAYFKREGQEIIAQSVRSDAKGLVSFYLKRPVAGFAVHVVRRN